jgi:molecular chaperone DnaJ
MMHDRKLPDFYATLGIPEDATGEEVKQAYRRLVKHFHPDRAETGDQARFREVQQAYETLGSPEKRGSYDRARTGVRREPAAARWGEVGAPDPLEGIRLSFAPRGPRSGREIVLSPEEALRGGFLRLEVAVEMHCRACQGTGGGFYVFCRDCSGAGRIRCHRPVRFVVPAGVEHGAWLSASLGPGLGEVGARVEISRRF